MKSALVWALLPPGSILLLLTAGLLIRRRLGALLVLSGTLLLLVLSTPYLAWPLISAAQWSQPPLTPQAAKDAGASAIVLLGAGALREIPDYGETVNGHSLVRLRHAARVHRWTGLPVIPSGGTTRGTPVAELMARILREELGVPVERVEDRSLNTHENALYSRRLLQPLGVDRVILVTEAAHMARSVMAFEAAGFEVVPAATHYVSPMISLYAFTPQLGTLGQSALALHELAGLAWYGWRYRRGW